MGVALRQTNDASQIVLEGPIDITVAAELKTALVEALAAATPGKKIGVAAEAAVSLDVTAYQLLWAAGREAKNAGVAIALDGAIPEAASRALAEIGLDTGALFS